MTIGYSDYGRQAISSGADALIVNQLIHTTYNSAILPSGNYDYLNIYSYNELITDTYQVTVSWYNDIAGTQAAGSNVYVIQASLTLYDQIAVSAPYYQVTIIPVVGNDAYAVNAIFTLAKGYSRSLAGSVVGAPPLAIDVTVGAGASYASKSLIITTGRAILSIQQGNNSSWYATLSYYNWQLTANQVFAYISGATHGIAATVEFVMPSSPVTLTLHNTDTVSRTMIASLMYG